MKTVELYQPFDLITDTLVTTWNLVDGHNACETREVRGRGSGMAQKGAVRGGS